MAKPKKHPPDVVRQNCQIVLVNLEKYRQLLADVVFRRGEFRRENIGPARETRKELDKYGKRLLKTGKAWKMIEWVQQHREWLPLARSGFFDGDAYEDSKQACSLAWGADLERFLLWQQATEKPLGYSASEREQDNLFCEWVIDDVERDIKALLAAANEQLGGPPGNVDVRPPLTPRERAVLDLIPYDADGAIVGKEIVSKLRDTPNAVGQSDLTSDI